MATVKVCDHPGCGKTQGVETFNLQGESMQKEDFNTFDLCQGHQTLLLRWIVKNRDGEILAHKILSQRITATTGGNETYGGME